MRILLVVFALLACPQAQAAALRSLTTLHGPNVLLRDLFDDAGPNADRVLGPGPVPGGRIILEAPQLNAIARQFSVPWRSLSLADRTVLEWPGRPLPKADAIDAVRLAVIAAGAASDVDIDIPGFIPPVVPVGGMSNSTVSQLEYDSNTGRFTAALTVTGEGMAPIDIGISGRVDEMVEAPVAAARLPAETVLHSDDVRFARMRTTLAQIDVARSIEQIAGMQLRRSVAAGRPLRLADLRRPPLVQRGATVKVELLSPGLSVSGQAIALDGGAAGERIRVQNITSRALLFAQVVGPGMTRIIPDAFQTLPAAAAYSDRRGGGQ
ncbi:MAG TPA: flagellar basal body P-ring formation chaperone FlgA [Rhodopila sp.]